MSLGVKSVGSLSDAGFADWAFGQHVLNVIVIVRLSTRLDLCDSLWFGGLPHMLGVELFEETV